MERCLYSNRHYHMNHHSFTSKQQAHAGFCGGITVCLLKKFVQEFDASSSEWRKVLVKLFTKAVQHRGWFNCCLTSAAHLVKGISTPWLISINWLLPNAAVKKPAFTMQLSSEHLRKQRLIHESSTFYMHCIQCMETNWKSQQQNRNHKEENTRTLTSTGKGRYLLSTRIATDWIHQ